MVETGKDIAIAGSNIMFQWKIFHETFFSMKICFNENFTNVTPSERV